MGFKTSVFAAATVAVAGSLALAPVANAVPDPYSITVVGSTTGVDGHVRSTSPSAAKPAASSGSLPGPTLRTRASASLAATTPPPALIRLGRGVSPRSPMASMTCTGPALTRTMPTGEASPPCLRIGAKSRCEISG